MRQGNQARYQFLVPEEGITVRLCIQNGRVVLYASTVVPNPNAAFYEYQLECIDCNNCDLYVGPEVTPGKKRSLYKRQSDTNVTLYVAVEGLADNSTFILDSTVGDTATSIGKVFCDTEM